ncbi:glycosyltransferase [Thermodesulfobacteriota bacterium]
MKKTLSVYHYCYLPFSETFIYRQLLGLSTYFDLTILTHKIEDTNEFPGLHPILIPKQKRFRRLFDREKRFFQKYLRASDLFHVNFGHIAIHMQDQALRAGIPMITHFHGVDASACLKDPLYCEKLKKSKFQAVFVCSEDMKKRLSPYLPKDMKCFVSYYGLPLEKFPFKHRRSIPDGPTFLQVSRLDTKKGLNITIEAFSKYSKEVDSKSNLVITGDGPLRDELESQVLSLGIDDKVHFLGVVGYKKLIELFHSTDVFLHPSVTDDNGDMEGIPNAICEAMATGMPVISTRHSGIPELIDHRVSGLLAKEGDVQSLFDMMVLLKEEDIGEISRRARTQVEDKFDYSKTIKILSDHIMDIVS